MFIAERSRKIPSKRNNYLIKKEMKNLAEYIYFNIWNNHFKMWGYESYKNVNTSKVQVIFYWGRIADSLQKLQTLEKDFKYWDTIDLIRKKIDEKLRKGYVAVLNSDYTKFSGGQISIGHFIQVIENQKGEANSLSLF